MFNSIYQRNVLEVTCSNAHAPTSHVITKDAKFYTSGTYLSNACSKKKFREKQMI